MPAVDNKLNYIQTNGIVLLLNWSKASCPLIKCKSCCRELRGHQEHTSILCHFQRGFDLC